MTAKSFPRCNSASFISKNAKLEKIGICTLSLWYKKPTDEKNTRHTRSHSGIYQLFLSRFGIFSGNAWKGHGLRHRNQAEHRQLLHAQAQPRARGRSGQGSGLHNPASGHLRGSGGRSRQHAQGHPPCACPGSGLRGPAGRLRRSPDIHRQWPSWTCRPPPPEP